ncbi:MAG: hypothetical protein GX644_17215 [Limnobacter sp.]|nr:hypothetical protein [Limnobacter sp.]
MVIDVNSPAAMSTAWLELCWRTGALQQGWAQRWAQCWAETVQHATNDALQSLESVAGAVDWKSRAARIDDAGWQAMQGGLDTLQRFASTAMDAQSEFSTGMREAVRQWQRDSARALHARRSAMPLYTAIRDVLNAVAVDAVDPGPAPGAPRSREKRPSEVEA